MLDNNYYSTFSIRSVINDITERIALGKGVSLEERKLLDYLYKELGTRQKRRELAYPTGTDITLVPMSLQSEIAKRLYLKYHDWIAEWNGDEPNIREHTTFLEWREDK